ncbi:MAG: response regulator transcription factor [Pyrinomonadaceae bacterium]
MKVLIADDDDVARMLLLSAIKRWGYEAISATDGSEALAALQSDDPPALAILDWMMPGMNGVEVSRAVRSLAKPSGAYIILLTARSGKEDIVAALDAGADDYLTKPYHSEELRVRVQAGIRIVELQRSLAARINELEAALVKVKQLQGMLPICSYCKKIRDDENYWQKVENYISDHADVQFSHSVCPKCYDDIVVPDMKKFLRAHSAVADTAAGEGGPDCL